MKQYVIFLSFILCLAYQAKAQAIIDTIESPNGQDYTACFDSLYQNVKFSDAPYGILYDRVVPFARLQQFGITNSDTSSYWHFIQAYSELQRAAVAPQKELPLTVDKLKAMAVEATIPIGIINFDYSSLDTDAYHTGRLYRSNGLWHENSSIQGNLFTVHHAVVAAPLRQVLVGSTFDFMLAAGIVFSSQGAGISRVSIDFDNGNGLQVIGLDRKITVSYTSFGLKKMKFVITLADGSEVTTYARFRVVETEASDHTRSTSAYDCPRYVENQTVNAQIAFQGYDESQAYCGRAEVRYYFANSDRELRRPILIVDGFDPMDVRQFERHKENDVWVAGGIWQRLDYKTSNGSTQNAGDKLICEGYDIVMVNMPPYTVSGKSIDGGSDYIERNAFTVIEIINEINKRLAASGSSEQIVAVGPSMGGQITRYALRYMETHPADAKTNYGKHNCRLWVSFDSPHVGANIAYGGQAFLHYVGQWSRGEFAKEKYDKVLCNHAAKQMLQLHMADPNHWHQAYYAAVDALGYPNQLRRIAITNGSLNGTHTGYDHQLAVTIHSSLFSADIRMITAGSDTQNDNHVFYGHYPFGGAITYKQRFGQGCGADAAPGGTYNTFQQIYEPTMKSLMETTGPIINGPHCALNSPSHCFMPTYSTLGYWNGWQNSCQDLWNNGNRNLVAEGVIPFQSYWGPVGYNMEHVTCNPALVEYLFNEIETYIAGEKAMPVCTTQTITMHLPADRTNNTIVTWTCSPGLEILSGQGTPTVQVRAKTAGQAWIKATSSNLSYNKEVKQFDITVSGNSALPPLPSSFDITGNQHITWNTPVTLDRELNIRWNGELRITAPVYCTPGADIRIQGGGHLIIDGGTLTNACDGQTWPGIKVYTLSTLDPANFGAQGKVTLQNGATVSNAQTAIRVIAPEENSATAVLTGYIKATGASFVNNRTAIAFDAIRPAGSTSAGASALRSFSSFTLCTFETDNSYGFATHASLNSVRNVTFSGCTFSYANASPDPVLITATTAIKATDAGFTVQPSCVLNALYSFFYGPCPENTPRSTFNGFQTAISARNTGSSQTFTVNGAVFENNGTGILADAVNNFSVLKSRFAAGVSIPGTGYGMQVLNATGYRIEENDFTTMLSPGKPAQKTGLLIKNSGGSNNEVYKNNFFILYIGQQFIGLNRSSSGEPTGLKTLCNTHTGITGRDIEVLTTATGRDKGGIAAFQQGSLLTGTGYRAAGNSFSTAPVNYSNQADYIRYSWHGSTLNGNPVAVEGNMSITNEANINPNGCPSKIDRLFALADEYQMHTALQNVFLDIYDSTKSCHNTLDYNYRRLLDGGSTRELMDAVQGEWKDDVWKMRQELMRQAPYLSRDILMEIAKKNALPQALFLEICLANPDATKDYGFLKFLQYEIPNPLPAYMIALIESSWSQKTLRTDMESALSAMGSEKDYWLNLLISDALQDSSQNRTNIRSLYRDRASYSDYFSMAESYIEENDFDKAFETIYDLTESLPKITAEQDMEISDFKDYIAYRRELHENNQSIHGLDTASLEWLITFENTHTGRGRVLAHNILCGLYDICLEELPEKLQAMASGGVHGGATSSSAPSAGKVQVFPNPAKEYTSFIWDFGSFDGTAQLSITDQNGRPLLTRSLPGAQGQWIWETAGIPSGSYVYSVTASGLQIETGKIVVVK